MEAPEHSVGVLLRLGAEAEVLAPESLRRAVAAAVDAMHRTYVAPT